MIIAFSISFITALILILVTNNSSAWGLLVCTILGVIGSYIVFYKNKFFSLRIKTAIILLIPIIFFEWYSIHFNIVGSLGLSFLIVLIITSFSRDLYLLSIIIVISNLCFLYNLFFTTIGGEQHFPIYVYNIVVFQIGWILLCVLSYMSNEYINEIIQKTQEAEYAARLKSEFLANVSHEIRTPMNAILGFTTIIQHQNQPKTIYDNQENTACPIKDGGKYDGCQSNKLQENVLAIRTAAHTLLSLINDILDFSKIESGKYEIVPVTYELASLIEDTITMISVRIENNPIQFFIDVDPQLPQCLIGDNVRVRQILANLLSNATKYTKHGFVKLRMWGITSNKKLLFYLSVQDTGSGIKEEDKSRLFETFRKFDVYKNREIEGTGIGLALTRQLCESMNGSISVESTYGEGSTFTVMIAQEIPDYVEPFVNIKIDPSLRVVVCDPNREELKIWAKILQSFNIDYILVASFSEFEFLLNSDPNTHYFLDSRVFRLSGSRIQNQKNNITIIADRNETFNFTSSIPILYRPIYILPIAKLLANIGISSPVERRESILEQFIAPEARILVVDDNPINLVVFAGLLEPYSCDVLSANCGREAVNLMENEYFDLVFMDQMMPELDGLETMKLIRDLSGRKLRCPNKDNEISENIFIQVDDSYFKKIPIIVATANAIAGMREEYLNSGFNDYIAKPIHMSHLHAVLKQWIPTEKQLNPNAKIPETQTTPNKISEINPGVNVDMLSKLSLPFLNVLGGLRFVSNNIANYFHVLESFRLRAPENINSVRLFFKEERWKALTIEVHSIKSISKIIGAEQLSALAAEMETAGKLEDHETIRQNIEQYIKTFQSVLNDVDLVLQMFAKPESAENAADPVELNTEELYSTLNKALAALLEYDAAQTAQILKGISVKSLTPEFANMLEEIQRQVAKFDYKHAIQGIKNLIQQHKQ
ncbi:MAG: response regulator [Planctomycetaceae bacterium]|jgi:signal transduction histidine kinase/CheY-like chemotaxis protein/HPt (histidine-containing phosphotransfer) domain-containing protein|nr:response regulator [Planctomycetaceae bacterium]